MKGFNCLVVIAIIFGITLLSCDKNDSNDKIDDPMYPTTFNRLSEKDFLQMRNDFAQRNPTMISSIDRFGFAGWSEELINAASSSSGTFTEEEAIEAVRQFVALNPETGITAPNNLQIEQISQGVGADRENTWIIKIGNQKINNIEIYDTSFSFNLRNRALYFCNGHHFPNVYVPENFNFDIERAKLQLLGREVIISGWGGPMNFGKVKAKDLQGSAADLIIVPQRSEEKIELRVTWRIGVSTMPYVFYVDVMNGEIIMEGATVIA